MSNVDTLMSVTDKLLQQETGGTLVLAGGGQGSIEDYPYTWRPGKPRVGAAFYAALPARLISANRFRDSRLGCYFTLAG
jgi:hypothetical protein